MNIRYRKVFLFIGLTYLLTLLFHIVLQFIGGRTNPVSLNLLGIPMLFPFISVIVVQKFIYRDKLRECLALYFKFNRWYIAALIIPLFMALLTNASNIILFHAQWLSTKDIVIILLSNTLIGLTIASLSAVFEEFAWRGFLYEEFKALGILKSSVYIGVLWAVWHIPVAVWYKYPNNPISGLLINCLQMLVLSIIISYIRYNAGSIFPSALMHGILNTLFLSTSAILFSIKDDFRVEVVKILVSSLILFVVIIMDFSKKKKSEIYKMEKSI